MSTDIKKYLALQSKLVSEKARIEARLSEITKVLGQNGPPAPVVSEGGRRKLSEATKAKMRAAHQARWAKIRGKATPAAAPKQRKMSAAGRAAIAAAAKARWAKVKTQKQGAKSSAAN